MRCVMVTSDVTMDIERGIENINLCLFCKFLPQHLKGQGCLVSKSRFCSFPN